MQLGRLNVNIALIVEKFKFCFFKSKYFPILAIRFLRVKNRL
jgi:hypothetical protein